MNEIKFKQIASLMKFAFGLQNIIEVKYISKGISVIAMELNLGCSERKLTSSVQSLSTNMTQ
jgi:chemotaxis protein MotB